MQESCQCARFLPPISLHSGAARAFFKLIGGRVSVIRWCYKISIVAFLFSIVSGQAQSDTLWHGDQKPQRIVSLNICADELVLQIADPKHILSVTWLAKEPSESNVVARAGKIPSNHGLAAEVIPLEPDLVVVGTVTTPIATSMIKRAGIPLLVLPPANSVEDVRRQIQKVAKVVGEVDHGSELLDRLDRRFEDLSVLPEHGRPTAIVFSPNGFTAGPGTLVDDVIRRSGFDNLAGRRSFGAYHHVPLEILLSEPPDVLIIDSVEESKPSLASQILSHPALLRLSERIRLISIPSRLWICPGFGLADAATRLNAVANELLRSRQHE